MNIGVIGTYLVSIVLFVMAYVARDEGFLPLAFLFGGGVLAIAGAYFTYTIISKKD